MWKKIQAGFYIDVQEENGGNNTKLIVSNLAASTFNDENKSVSCPVNFYGLFFYNCCFDIECVSVFFINLKKNAKIKKNVYHLPIFKLAWFGYSKRKLMIVPNIKSWHFALRCCKYDC